MSQSILSPEELARALGVRDLSDPAAGPHAIQIVINSIIKVLTRWWGCPVVIHRANPIVSVYDNYERIRVPPEATARDARYTRYVSATTVLRTSMTAMIPPLLAQCAADPQCLDILLAPVGLVYRRDAIDRLHVGEPHQMDLWRLRRGEPRLRVDNLEAMIRLVAGVVAPGAPIRCTPTEHPYTLSGRQIDIQVHNRWVEIGECGMAHAELLQAAGMSAREWSGLAMGIGLDRAVMLRKGIDDIRLLRSDDPRVSAQMTDLSAYRPVSNMPPVRRDLSLAVAPGTDAETLGDRVRERLGDRAVAIEDLTIVAATPAHDLPPQAVARIGIRPDQVNLLVRLTLRHPSQTLTNDAANQLRDEVYAILHEGEVYQWAAA